jgi:hypothetical protein
MFGQVIEELEQEALKLSSSVTVDTEFWGKRKKGCEIRGPEMEKQTASDSF